MTKTLHGKNYQLDKNLTWIKFSLGRKSLGQNATWTKVAWTKVTWTKITWTKIAVPHLGDEFH